MKISLAQLNYTPGDVTGNSQKILSALSWFKQQQTDLVVFSCLAVGGYPAFDLYTGQGFKQEVLAALREIQQQSEGIACLIGGIYQEEDRLYNAVYYMRDGQIAEVITKKNLSSWDWMDERRYFSSGKGALCVQMGQSRIGVAFNEDVSALYQEKALDLVVLFNGEAFSAEDSAAGAERLQALSEKLGVPVLESKGVGGQGDILFEGASRLALPGGSIAQRWNYFSEDSRSVDLPPGESLQAGEAGSLPSELSLIHQGLVMGLRDFFHKQGFSKAILGLSGGLDSAVVAALACQALGPENVLAVLMPSIYSSDHALKDALDLVENTGCKHMIVPIKEVVSSVEAQLGAVLQNSLKVLTLENIQARARGLLLMTLSNELGYVVLNTSNKSESAVGYGTLYGDMVGALGVIGDVYKTTAFALARYINREEEIIPEHTIIKPPSAELRPDQKDSDSLPDYPVLDAILSLHLEKGFSAAQIIRSGYDEDLVKRSLTLVKKAEFKRYQSAPVLRVSSRAFGRGRQFSFVQK